MNSLDPTPAAPMPDAKVVLAWLKLGMQFHSNPGIKRDHQNAIDLIRHLQARIAELEAERDRLKAPRMFPLQTSRTAPAGPTSIPWSVAERAYGEYARQYGKGQSLKRLAERGGFSWCEMDSLAPGWREEVSELAQLRAELDRLRARLIAAHRSVCTADNCKLDGGPEHDEAL